MVTKILGYKDKTKSHIPAIEELRKRSSASLTDMLNGLEGEVGTDK